MTPPSLHLNFKQRVCACVTCHDWEGDDFFCPSVFFPLGEAKQLWNLGRRKRGKVVQYFVHLIKGYVIFFIRRAKNRAPVGMVKKETRTILKSSSWLREFVQVLSCWVAFVFPSMSCSTQWWTSLQCGGHLAQLYIWVMQEQNSNTRFYQDEWYDKGNVGGRLYCFDCFP